MGRLGEVGDGLDGDWRRCEFNILSSRSWETWLLLLYFHVGRGRSEHLSLFDQYLLIIHLDELLLATFLVDSDKSFLGHLHLR